MTNNYNQLNKSYPLGEELEVAGSFVYDGLEYIKTLDIHDPKHNVELFLAYYHIAVGIERICKIVLILSTNITKKGHNSYKLLENTEIFKKINENEKTLLKKMSEFYQTLRYNRLDFSENEFIDNTQEFEVMNDVDNLSETVLSIFNKLYKEVQGISVRDNLYTDGIRPNSKTSKLIR